MNWDVLWSGLYWASYSLWLAPFLELIPALTLCLAYASLRVRRRIERVDLVGFDGYAAVLLIVASPLVAIGLGVIGAVLGWQDAPFAWVLVGWFALAASCRVRIRAMTYGTYHERFVAFVRWRHRRLRESTAFYDGWGDFMDPEALHIDDVELGWVGRNGDNSLADRFNDAVAQIRGDPRGGGATTRAQPRPAG